MSTFGATPSDFSASYVAMHRGTVSSGTNRSASCRPGRLIAAWTSGAVAVSGDRDGLHVGDARCFERRLDRKFDAGLAPSLSACTTATVLTACRGAQLLATNTAMPLTTPGARGERVRSAARKSRVRHRVADDHRLLRRRRSCRASRCRPSSRRSSRPRPSRCSASRSRTSGRLPRPARRTLHLDRVAADAAEFLVDVLDRGSVPAVASGKAGTPPSWFT